MLALKYYVYQRLNATVGISNTDTPKGCPRQSILAIMTKLSANNHIVFSAYNVLETYLPNKSPSKTNSCRNNTDGSMQKGIVIKSAVIPIKCKFLPD